MKRASCRIVIAAACLVPALASAQGAAAPLPDPEPALETARLLLRQGHFDAAIERLREAIEQLQQLRDIRAQQARLADAHLLLGLAYLATRDETSARENFALTLGFDPERVLDPEIYAPKVVELFEQARAETGRKPPRRDPGPGSIPSAPKATAPWVSLSEGAWVRARISGDRSHDLQGTLLTLGDRTLALTGPEGETIELPRELIARLQVRAGRRGHAWQGAVIGAVVGVISGLVEQPGCDGSTCFTKGENIVFGGLGMAGAGALIGKFHRTEEWVEIPVDRLAPPAGRSPAGRENGAALSFHLSF